MLWVKALHIIFMVTWFAGLFYLPRLFVYHAQASDRISLERFKLMERKLFWGIMTPGAVLTIVFGVWLWLGWFRGAGTGCTRRSRWSRCSSATTSGAAAAARLRRRAQRAGATLVPLVQRVPGAGARSPRCSWLSSSPSERFLRHRAARPRGFACCSELAVARRARTPCAVPGGVAFGGDWEVCYAANLWSRLASRVLWQRAPSSTTPSEEDVYERRKRVDWPKFFAVERTLRVNVTAQKSPLKSLEFATLRIKDAVCDRFRDATRQPSGRRPRRRRTCACMPSSKRTSGTLYLDTSGEPLFKRGWRAEHGRGAAAREPGRRHRDAHRLAAGASRCSIRCAAAARCWSRRRRWRAAARPARSAASASRT